MKKSFVIVLLFAFLFTLVGCDPLPNSLDRKELLENTVKIELFDYENESPKLLDTSGKRKPRFDFDKATFLAALDESQFEALIDDLTKSEYLLFGTALNEPMGKTLVLHQSSGNMYVLFGCPYTSKWGDNKYFGDCYLFDRDGNYMEHIGDVSHRFSERIVSEYFQDIA